MRFRNLSAVAAALLVLGGCSEARVTPEPSAANPVVDTWLGRWNGPEGTYLALAAAEAGVYQITIANLDGPRSFPGVAGNDGLSFERDGVHETLRATDGEATGMKWLTDKTDCLTVRPGEGFCRD